MSKSENTPKNSTTQMKHFEVLGIPRVYISPRQGRVDLTKPLKEEKAIALYKDENFPYLGLKSGAEELFKKEKVDTILFLINKASRASDVEILSDAKPESPKVKAAVEDKLATLNKKN